MNLPKVDLVYSIIVLQHNPPPIISLIIKGFIKARNSGGAALFQVPTYRIGYAFCLEKYLSNEATKQEMEMHLLAQKNIFQIVKKQGGEIVEVLEDAYTGLNYKEISNTLSHSQRVTRNNLY